MSRMDAMEIWRAGVAAADPYHLIKKFVKIEPGKLWGEFFITIDNDKQFHLSPQGRIIVIGMGKASGAMAQALEEILIPQFPAKRIHGWVNVPDNCLTPLKVVHLHPGRKAAVNEPSESGIVGSKVICGLVDEASPDDLIFCLISGGGSALLPLPANGITLLDKQRITRFLSGAGAGINELNTVRKELSQIKGGGLRRRARGKRLISLVLSDVLGDPVDMIASGATVPNTTNAKDALAVLEKYGADLSPDLLAVCDYIQKKADSFENNSEDPDPADYSRHYYRIIGNNRTAVDGAAEKARALGYHPLIRAASQSEGKAEEVGKKLYDLAKKNFYGAQFNGDIDCIIEGGEPVVHLAPESLRGKGGRNQQLILAALIDCLQDPLIHVPILFSGGTDGEDGPTENAGAFFDRDIVIKVLEAIKEESIDPEDYLERNDAGNFFELFDALIFTGPTGTNVCDIRVALKGISSSANS
ncbi:MAG: DUF4147 domain-containing protein [Planctomycetia bacterium]|nr:DUF4147 domain-containing protein [Planctomycetia bacterium]